MPIDLSSDKENAIEKNAIGKNAIGKNAVGKNAIRKNAIGEDAMLKRKTILLMVSAIALFGLVALFEGNRSVTNSRSKETTPTDSTLQADGEPLF